MKIALVGAGKTGHLVKDYASKEKLTIFDINNPPTLEKLEGHDVIISFLPGKPFSDYIQLFLESKLPVVTASTGFDWPAGIDQKLKDLNITWITGSNFSLGIQLIRKLIATINENSELATNPKYKIHEIHHITKKDAPSGTAISMKNWLKNDSEVISDRVEDVNGIHTLTIETENETISLSHTAKSRKIFAEGAIWAASKLVNEKMEPGLQLFENFF
jgi:4-hydroxy-tetrahydrodipicolinate reductase